MGICQFFLRSTLAFFVFNTVAARPTLEVTPNPKRNTILRRDADADADPDDQSWIKNWAAIGDSFAAGIGAGSRLGGLGDYWCSRTDQSYPSQINTDVRMGGSPKFTYWACSGATIYDVLDKQLPELPSGQDMVTLSAGGNDLNFTTILNYCIFTWNDNPKGVFEGGRPKSCARYLEDAQNYVKSDELAQSLDNVISQAKAKLSSDGTLYYTGYAKFFGEEDNQCDKVSWSFWWGLHWQYLTLDRRQTFNDIIDGLNQKISEAADRAGDQVVFVDWGVYVENTMGRFCEKGFPETDGNRVGLRYYEYYTDDTKDPDNLTPRQSGSGSAYLEGTFEWTISALVQDFMKRNDTGTNKTTPYQTFAIAAEQPSASDAKYNPSDDQKNLTAIQSVLPDSYTRIFHPRPDGHSIISNLLFYHMAVTKAKKLNFSMPPEVGHSDTCPAPIAVAAASSTAAGTKTADATTKATSATKAVATSTAKAKTKTNNATKTSTSAKATTTATSKAKA